MSIAFFRFDVWHKLELFRTRRPVVGMFQPFDMSRHVCVFIIGFIAIRAQREMVYTQLLQHSVDQYRNSQIVCDRW